MTSQESPSSEELVCQSRRHGGLSQSEQCLSCAAFQEAASKQDRMTGISHLYHCNLRRTKDWLSSASFVSLGKMQGEKS